ncbi:hypothetical protein ACJW30_02G202800 [Castanea mollissima]
MGSLESSGAEVVTVDVHATKNLINSGHKYLDVRTVEEYKKGHVGADKILNIPYMFNTPEGRVKNPQFLSEVSSACNKEDQLIVGCQSGVRSLSATADLLSAGFKHVSNMGGGYLAWVENGFLVQKPDAELSGAEVVTVDVHATKDLINSGHKYLDVRTVEEYKKGHVGADKILNIPYMFNTPAGRVKNPQFLSEVSSVCNKEDQLIVGCQSGVRSLSAAADLLSAGFKHVSNMGGGYLAWVENGFLVQKPHTEL